MSEEIRPSRRIVFQGLGALGVAVALAGCGGGDDTTGSGSPTAGGSQTGTGGGTDDGSTGSKARPLARTSQVPVGGGIILTDQKIVITQPTQGEFTAYSAICKHQGLTVTRVEGGEVICDHHGSRYDAASGEVTNPPAPAPLDEVPIKVEGNRILAA